MDKVWKALDEWATKLGILEDVDSSQRLDVTDLDIKKRDDNVTEFTRRRNQQDILGAAKLAAA
jgi:hypothetical protein